MDQYIPKFLDGGFDDMDFVQDMTVEDLDAIGVSKTGHRRKLWMAVSALSKDTGKQVPADKGEEKQEETVEGSLKENPAQNAHDKPEGRSEEKLSEGEEACVQTFCQDRAEELVDAANVKAQSVPCEASLQSAPNNGPSFAGKPFPNDEHTSELDCYAGSSDDLYSTTSSSSSNISVIEVPKQMPTFDLTTDVQHVDVMKEIPALNAEELEEASPAEAGDVSFADAKEMPLPDLTEESPQVDLQFQRTEAASLKGEESRDVVFPQTQMKSDEVASETNNNDVSRGHEWAASEGDVDKELSKPPTNKEVSHALSSTPQSPASRPAPPPVKPKSFKKQPPRVPPKPRADSSRGASFTDRTSDLGSGVEAENSTLHSKFFSPFFSHCCWCLFCRILLGGFVKWARNTVSTSFCRLLRNSLRSSNFHEKKMFVYER